MFGVSLPELIIIFVVALVVFGPDKLPEIARKLGLISGQLRKHSNAMRREFYNAVYTPADELRTRINNETQELRAVSNNLLNLAGRDPLCSDYVKPQETTAASSPTAESSANPETPVDVEKK